MRVLLLSIVSLLVACGASTESPATTDAGSDSIASDTKSTGDGGCITPVQGAACAAGDDAKMCAGVGGGCCDGYVWSCMAGAWNKAGVGCACLPDDAGPEVESGDALLTGDAGPFSCGSMTCGGGQLCKEQGSGIDGGSSSFSCDSVPSSCAATPTCACVKAAGVPGCAFASCKDDGKGHLTVTCFGA